MQTHVEKTNMYTTVNQCAYTKYMFVLTYMYAQTLGLAVASSVSSPSANLYVARAKRRFDKHEHFVPLDSPKNSCTKSVLQVPQKDTGVASRARYKFFEKARSIASRALRKSRA
jgi:23S rRNA U2552 (ribose-2'-O)-methylase RlmE/FtsJ